MLRGENIVCFAKDWTEDPTSNNHVMRELSKDNEVLWLNSIAQRTPSFASGRDLKKIVNKVKSFAKGYTTIGEHLHVYTPLVVPFPHSRAAIQANRLILRASIRALRKKLGMGGFQLWTFLPSSHAYAGHLGEELVVYYCTDEFSQFKYLDGARIAEQEQKLIKKADIVFCTSRTLVERKSAFNSNVHLASHGVDQAHFAKALDEQTPVPAEIANLKGPVLGFFGLIESWVDVELMAEVARRRPEWNLVVIGKALHDVSALEKLPNVKLLGRKPYGELPLYCKRFDVGLIPFKLTDLTVHVNPIKLREYFSAGLAVVSTDMPEVRGYKDCYVANTADETIAKIEVILSTDNPDQRKRRSVAMLEETWTAKVRKLGEHVNETLARKRGRQRA